MRLASASIACLSLLAACSSSPQSEDKPKSADSVATAGEEKEENELDVRDLVGEAKVSLGQALETAMHAYPEGEAVAAALEGDVEGGKRSVAYEVSFVSVHSGEAHVVKVDHVTRKVLVSEKESDAGEAKEALDRQKAAGAHHRPLLDLLHHAAQSDRGTAVEIAFSRKHAGTANVTFVKDRAETTVTLDAETGRIAETK